MMNITASVPAGSSNHGNPSLVCTPPAWTDYIVFLFTNYLAHAATTVSFPGQSKTESLRTALWALLMPVYGIWRALKAMSSLATFYYRDPIKQAARSGALCMVVNDLRCSPKTGGHWYMSNQHSQNIDGSGLLVQGDYRLQGDWHLVYVPRNAPVTLRKVNGSSRGFLSTPYNVPKLLISLVQAIWAIRTVYRARGDQIDRFGYAAFGLTVIQYALMSIMNTAGNILQPEYPALFMIRTPLMTKAEQQGCYFSGELAVELGDSDTVEQSSVSSSRALEDAMILVLSIVIGLVPLAIVGILSGFKARSSTLVQRLFTMLWLAFSFYSGASMSFTMLNERFRSSVRSTQYLASSSGRSRLNTWIDEHSLVKIPVIFLSMAVCAAPSIAGFVVATLMFRDYGICTRMD